jgi:hypothetical protein
MKEEFSAKREIQGKGGEKTGDGHYGLMSFFGKP